MGILKSIKIKKKVKIWNITEGNIKVSFDAKNGGHTAWVRSLAYLGKGMLASGSGDSKSY